MERNKTGDYSGALSDFDRAIDLQPSFVEAYISRAYTKDFMQDHNGAVVDCMMALELNPDATEAYYIMGNAMVNLEKYKEAIDLYEKAADFYGSQEGVDEPIDKLINIKKSIELYQLSSKTLNYEGFYLFDLGLYLNGWFVAGIVEDTNNIIRAQTDFIAYKSRGYWKVWEINDYLSGLADLSYAIKLNPIYFDAYYERAYSHYLIRKYESALEDVNTAIDLALVLGSDSSHYRLRADIKKKMNDNYGAKLDNLKSHEIDTIP